jgi:hypothetical protein
MGISDNGGVLKTYHPSFKYHVFKKSGRILDRGTTEMDQYAIELFER